MARAIAAQTRPPDLWLIVDDHSTDGTYELAERLAGEFPFITPLRAPEHPPLLDPRDRLASAAAPRTFNFGLRQRRVAASSPISPSSTETWSCPPDYFERILGEFEADQSLGMAGGLRAELVRGRWRLERVPTEHHVNGALKCYSRECFEAIGGIQERLAWDTIDETARPHARLPHPHFRGPGRRSTIAPGPAPTEPCADAPGTAPPPTSPATPPTGSRCAR